MDKDLKIQTDRDFEQNKTKRLNKKYNMQMFSLKVRGSKAFLAKQKIREFKKLLFKTEVLHERFKKE